jgi:chromosome segregation ATPase
MTEESPVTDTLIARLRERARIRRQIPGRKAAEEGKPDRIADVLDEAADALSASQSESAEARGNVTRLLADLSECSRKRCALVDALSASQAELRDCERRCDEWREQSNRDSALAVCNETLRAEIRRLREALQKYGEHAAFCYSQAFHPGKPQAQICDCGFAALAGTEGRK